MKSSRRAATEAAVIGFLLHTATVLWAWRTWGTFGRGNVISWLDLPASIGYMHLDGGPFLAWSLAAGGLQWAGIGALVALLVGRAARRGGKPSSADRPPEPPLAAETSVHSIELGVAPEQALAALTRAVEGWGAQIEATADGRRLVLPVVSGLRKGLVAGPVTIEPLPEGSRVVFRAEESHLVVQTAAVAILLLAGAGGVLTVLWPFVPQMLPVAPFGALLALGGWFLVVSRLRTSGPDELLAAVAAEAGGAPAAL